MPTAHESTTQTKPTVGLDNTALLAEASELLPDAIVLRRQIHAEPELGLQLPMTQTKILGALADLDLSIELGDSVSSVVATLTGAAEGPTILLRGDMDALPMPEDSGEPFASKHDGMMHACGHDSHVAMLASAARLLHDRRSELRGNVKFLFQPGEEGFHGARYCLDEGLLDNPKVDAAFALHVFPNLPAGALATRAGPLMAAADEFAISVKGKGGHASAPHLAVDPIPAACEMVTALQTLITRSVDVFHPAVLTVGKIAAGTTTNVIPESAHIEGTIRTVSEKTRDEVHDGLRRVVNGLAQIHGCVAEVEIDRGYPVTVNDKEFVSFATRVMTDLVGPDNIIEMGAPVMGAEDWSYVLQQVPGAMAFLGVCPNGLDPSEAHACHSNHMKIDEEVMAVGIATHAAVALSYLS